MDCISVLNLNIYFPLLVFCIFSYVFMLQVSNLLFQTWIIPLSALEGPNPWTRVSICISVISLWVLNKHLKVNKAKLSSSHFSKPNIVFYHHSNYSDEKLESYRISSLSHTHTFIYKHIHQHSLQVLKEFNSVLPPLLLTLDPKQNHHSSTISIAS